MPNFQRLEPSRSILIEPTQDVSLLPRWFPIDSQVGKGNVFNPLWWDLGGPGSRCRKRDRILLVDLGGARPSGEELPAPIPRLLHLVAIGDQPLQVKDGQLPGPDQRPVISYRDARLVQGKGQRSVVVHLPIVDHRHRLPGRPIQRQIVTISSDASPQMIEETFDGGPGLELMDVAIEKLSRQAWRHELVRIVPPQSVASVVAARGVQELPAALFAHANLGGLQHDDLRESAADFARAVV